VPLTKEQIVENGLRFGVHAPAEIEKHFGKEVSAAWLGAALAGMSVYARLLVGEKGAYDCFQKIADSLAEPLITPKAGTTAQ